MCIHTCIYTCTENDVGRLTPTDSHGHIDIGVHATAKNLDQFQEQEQSLGSCPKEVGQHEVV